MRTDINRCEECESEYFSTTSKMSNLCPECSHILYNYQNCTHVFENNRCVKCFWNGNTTQYTRELKLEKAKDNKQREL